MKTHIIYAFIDDSGNPFYVGKTNDLKIRKQAHLYEVKKGNTLPKYNKLRKLLREGHEFSSLIVVLEKDIPYDQVDNKEIHHIRKLREEGYKLRNLTDGGEGMSNPSPELVERLRQSKLGQKRSKESRKRMSDARKGIKFSTEHKKNLSIARRKRVTKQSTRDKMSATSKGKINIKKYELVDPHGNVHITENGLTLFCEQHGLSHPNIIKVANGQRPRHKGWTAKRLG